MLVSNHFIIHFGWNMCLHLSFLSVRLVSSRHTAHVLERWARHIPFSTAFCLHFVPFRVRAEQFMV